VWKLDRGLVSLFFVLQFVIIYDEFGRNLEVVVE
jgi:hypothetical protein